MTATSGPTLLLSLIRAWLLGVVYSFASRVSTSFAK